MIPCQKLSAHKNAKNTLKKICHYTLLIASFGLLGSGYTYGFDDSDDDLESFVKRITSLTPTERGALLASYEAIPRQEEAPPIYPPIIHLSTGHAVSINLATKILPGGPTVADYFNIFEDCSTPLGKSQFRAFFEVSNMKNVEKPYNNHAIARVVSAIDYITRTIYELREVGSCDLGNHIRFYFESTRALIEKLKSLGCVHYFDPEDHPFRRGTIRFTWSTDDKKDANAALAFCTDPRGIYMMSANPDDYRDSHKDGTTVYQQFHFTEEGVASTVGAAFVIDEHGKIQDSSHVMMRRDPKGILFKIIHGATAENPFSSEINFLARHDTDERNYASIFQKHSPLYAVAETLLGDKPTRLIPLPSSITDMSYAQLIADLLNSDILLSTSPVPEESAQAAVEEPLTPEHNVTLDAATSAPIPARAEFCQSSPPKTQEKPLNPVQAIRLAQQTSLEELDGRSVIKQREAAQLIAALYKAAPPKVLARLNQNQRGADGYVHAEGAGGVSHHTRHGNRSGLASTDTRASWTAEKVMATAEMLIALCKNATF